MKLSPKLVLATLSVFSMIVANWIYEPPVEHVHIHAGFRVYTDNNLQDYSDYKYMNFVPCSEHDTKKSAALEQIEKAHLHDSVGDVVHVHRSGAKWSDLFKNIGVDLATEKNLKGFVDGKEVQDILDEEIRPYMTAIFIRGEGDISHAKEIVSLEHIKEIEAKSELCGAD